MLTKEEIIRKVAEVPYWGQSIPLPHGIVTPGKVMSNIKYMKRLQLPESLKEKRVLDIGTWDGYYAFEAEKRGAEVVAIDNLQRMQRPDEQELAWQSNKGFETASKIMNSRVQFHNMDIYDVSPENIGMFDITLFLGVLYHLKHPLLALERVARITREMMIVETAWFKTFTRLPVLRYVEGATLNQDPSNHFVFNTPALIGMLRDCGFRNVSIVYKTPFTPLQMLKSLWINKSVMGQAAWNSNLCCYGRIILKAYK